MPTIPSAFAPRHLSITLTATLVLGACSDDGGGGGGEGSHDPGPGNDESEVINVVDLHFTPEGGGDTVSARFRDPDGDGAASGIAEPIELALGTTYLLAVAFSDDLSDPPEDITQEIREEAEEHQVFVFGTAVHGPATSTTSGLLGHSYADLESDYSDDIYGEDLPVGLRNTMVAETAGLGEIGIQLQHLPLLNGEPQKVPDLAEAFADDEALPGGVDALVTFDVLVR